MVEKPSWARMVATSASTSSCFMKFCTSSLASVSLFTSASDSVITFRSHPVSWLARRMFWPPRPMACDSFSSDTAMSMLCESSSTTMDMTSAGDMALITNCAGLSTYGMMSTRLARDLVGHRLHARAAHADAGADRIDARVVALHRDLGAHARITRRAQYLDEALPDLRDLQLEQLDEELGRGACEEQLRAARLGAHFLEEGFDAVLRLGLLARDHVGARYEPFGVAAQIDVNAVTVDALHHPAHERSDAVAVGVDNLGALVVVPLPQNSLVCLVGTQTPEPPR